MKKIFIPLIFIMILISNANAIGDSAILLPVLKKIFIGGTNVLKAVNTSASLTASTNGFGLNASALTNQVSGVTSKWVPDPFKDNVNNVVGSCLQDLQKSLFKKIKWPSVSVCGHDIIADLKQDIDKYVQSLSLRLNFGLGGVSFVSAASNRENQAYIKNVKGKILTDLQNIYNSGKIAQSGLEESLSNINNTKDSNNNYEKKDIVYNLFTHNQTLQNISDISKNISSLGVKFNSAIVSSAGKQMNESLHMDFHIKDMERLNNQYLNIYENVLQYKKIYDKYSNHNYKVNKHVIEANKITNVALLDDYLVLRNKNKTFNVKVPGDTSNKQTLKLIGQQTSSLATVFKENSSISSSSLDFNQKFLKEYLKYGDNKKNINQFDDFNYLTQATKIYRDSLYNIAEVTKKNNSDMGIKLKSNLYSEGIMNLLMIQIAQDYQANRSFMNIVNNNQMVEISLLKNISDKLRLLNYTNANLNK